MGKAALAAAAGYGHKLYSLLKETYQEWSTDNVSQLGAALAFYTIFSIAPILIIIVAVVGFILGKASVQSYLLQELTLVLGPENAHYVMNTIQKSYLAGSGLKATVIAILIILVGASRVCTMLKKALNTMWGVKGGPSGLLNVIIDWLKSLLIVLFAGGFLFLSMMVSSVISTTHKFLTNFIPLPLSLIAWADNLASLVLLTLLFAMLYKWLPDVEISWGDVWVGGAITAVLFFLGKYGLGLYLAYSTVSSAYGAAGSLVVLLLWVYYSAQIIFLGAEFTQVYGRRYGSEIVPKRPPEAGKVKNPG